MKKKILSFVTVLSVIVLVVLNVNVGMGTHWFNRLTLEAIEGVADQESDIAIKQKSRLESYLCGGAGLPSYVGTGTNDGFQKICESFTRYPSTCRRSEEVSCDGSAGAGSSWYNPEQGYKK